MKKILLALFLITNFYSYSQSPSDLFNVGRGISQSSNQDKLTKRFFSNIEIEFGVSNEIRYDYSIYDANDNLLGGRSTELDNKASYGILYSINYPVFNKLTLGAIGGFQHQVQQKISALKLGGILRYHFVNYESVNINLMTAYNIALSDNIESDMANVRLGLQFPITRTDTFNLNLNVFGDYNYYIYNEPILNEINERPGNLIFRSYGLSLGIQF
ncbi:hypothetical protein [Gillisia limnaea]|uniref:Outer membrane protein beta-barrel domain-containing protein n=1 Tax=Gillisia limnaea (strain DSM 15749 / LMG 21470 / R-8282) TaxID=865937 RepID=H2BVU1_GILLR|nr:hypothetical protein [Gillisia limnaea]EHQ01824.1 hypothetical protein Gilli_1150 [Gillisia limnaea DSM 15749]